MNQDTNSFDLLVEALSKSTQITLLMPANPSVDALAGAAAFARVLGSQGKQVSLASAQAQAHPQIAGSDKITRELASGGDQLVVSFPYVDGSIDKVDYKIENGTFNLIIIPRPGFDKITKEQLSYTYAGGAADCFVTFNAPTLTALGTLYTANQSMFDTVPVIVNIDTHETNEQYGNVNIVQKDMTMSELVYKSIQALGYTLDSEAATNLYVGIMHATQNLTATTASPEVFETIASLIRQGAKRVAAAPRQGQPTQAPKQQQPPRPPMQQNRGPNQQQSRIKQSGGSTPAPSQQFQQPAKPPAAKPVAPAPKPASPVSKPRPESGPGDLSQINKPKTWFDMLPGDNGIDMPKDFEGTAEKTSGFQDNTPQAGESADVPAIAHENIEAPADWLKPKIMKGNGLI